MNSYHNWKNLNNIPKVGYCKGLIHRYVGTDRTCLCGKQKSIISGKNLIFVGKSQTPLQIKHTANVIKKHQYLQQKYSSREKALIAAKRFYQGEVSHFITGYSNSLKGWIWCTDEDEHLKQNLCKIKTHNVNLDLLDPHLDRIPGLKADGTLYTSDYYVNEYAKRIAKIIKKTLDIIRLTKEIARIIMRDSEWPDKIDRGQDDNPM